MSRLRMFWMTSRWAPWLLALLITTALFAATAALELSGVTARLWF